MAEENTAWRDADLASLSDLERLELDRDVAHIDAKNDFQQAGIAALGAGGWGAMATIAAFSAVPYGALMSGLAAIPAAVYLWKGMQDIGKGVHDAARSASADTALRILYEHPPGVQVSEAQPAGRLTQGPTKARSS